MKGRAKEVVLGFGLATLYVTWMIGPLVNPNHLVEYHWAGSMPALFLPPTLDFLLGACVLAAFLFSFRINKHWHDLGWAFLVCFSPWFILKNAGLLCAGLPVRTLGHVLLFAGVVAFFARFAVPIHRRSPLLLGAMNFFSTLLQFAAIAGLLLLAQEASFAWQARDLNRNAPTHYARNTVRTTAPNARVFWIVLDELSFQQTYGHRFPGLLLPAFDRLQGSSTVFTQVIAAGSDTEKVLPSLLTGAAVDAVRSSPEGMLRIHSPDSGTWTEFSQKDNVFQDAADHGFQPALAGWYNPYCRILPSVFHRCAWTFGAIDTAMEYRASVARNMFGPLRYELLVGRSYRSLQRFFPLRESEALSAEMHAADYEDIRQASDEFVHASDDTFVFLHLPLPHPGGIYNRHRGQLTRGSSSYLDNLVLADRFLEQLEENLRKTGEWDSSTLVIMGDHGWRTNIAWSGQPGWTAEDEQASKAEALNRRPAMIVKLPGQTVGARIDEPFRAVQTRKLLNAFFRHEISTSGDLHDWVRRNP